MLLCSCPYYFIEHIRQNNGNIITASKFKPLLPAGLKQVS